MELDRKLGPWIALCLLPSVGAGCAPPPSPSPAATSEAAETTPATYEELVELFSEWRELERPELLEGAPDYSEVAMDEKGARLAELEERLMSMDVSDWSISQQVDHHLVRAEMNGMRFNLETLRPWERDPAFYNSVWTYQSDTPAHEGPTHHGLVELWTYEFPLDGAATAKLTAELATIPPLLAQARENLTGNARELWEAGIGDLRAQSSTLAGLEERVGDPGSELGLAIAAARVATDGFVAWLEEQTPEKDGASGIGRQPYTWYLQNVHLVPLTWEDEVRLLERELARAHSSLRLEEHRNRNLSPLDDISSPEEYERRANGAVDEYLGFLERENILPIRDYMDSALRARIGSYVPPEERNFFRTAIHFEPMTLWTHFYHWWDLARMEADPHPSPIRRGPLLYNIFDSRAEGMATGVEEMMMHAGLYDEKPRVREIVWIMLAQRAARGLGSLKVHANEFTMKEARDYHVEWTPRGWMREDLDLLGFEQLLYLRQPGYGTSYITGKYLIERLMMERAHQLGDEFSLSRFFDEVDALGVIPVSLLHWELTGDDSMVRALPAE